MNAKTHRLVFNKSRGCMMAVAETARSSGKGGASGERRTSRRSRQVARLSSHLQALNQPLAQAEFAQAAIKFIALVGITNQNLNLGTVKTASSSDQSRGADDFLKDSQSKELGSQIQATGNITLRAGVDLNARAANVQAGGSLTATAGNNVNITAGRQTNSFGFGLTSSESDLFSSTSTKERRTSSQTQAIGASLGGNTVISDNGTTLVAGNNISI